MRKVGIDAHFVQDNHSRSTRNMLHGLHYQMIQPQGKLVRVISGKVFDVAVDLRRASPAFGKWAGVELLAENERMFWLPPGMAHGFVALSDSADFVYKATDYYAPKGERSLLWNDPRIGTQWPFIEEPILSAKDMVGTSLKNAEVCEDFMKQEGIHAQFQNPDLWSHRASRLGVAS